MSKISSKYLRLIRSFPLRPIRCESELDRAEAILHQLLDAPRLSAPERDYLDAQKSAKLLEINDGPVAQKDRAAVS